MVGWHHWLHGHEFEQTLGDSEGQGSLACCSPWGCKESDMTEQLNNKQLLFISNQLAGEINGVTISQFFYLSSTDSLLYKLRFPYTHLCRNSFEIHRGRISKVNQLISKATSKKLIIYIWGVIQYTFRKQERKKESESRKVKSLSHVRFFATAWTVACQASPSMGFPRQEYWSGLPFPFPGDLPTPGLNPGLPHCRQTLYCLSHQGSPRKQGRVLIKEVKNILEKSFGYRVKNSQVIVNKENVYLKRRFRCIWMRRKLLDLFRRPKGSMTSHSQKEVEFSYSDNPFMGQWASVGGLSGGWTL